MILNANAENGSSSEIALWIGSSVLGSVPFTFPPLISTGDGM